MSLTFHYLINPRPTLTKNTRSLSLSPMSTITTWPLLSTFFCILPKTTLACHFVYLVMGADSTTIGTVNHISFGADRSTSMIKGVSYGSVVPGGTVRETLLLHSTGAAGDRTIDVSVQCSHSLPNTSTDTDAVSPVSLQSPVDISETLHTLVIPTQPPLQVESMVSYRRAIRSTGGSSLASTDLELYDSSTLTAQAEAIIRSTIVNQGPWDVAIETFRLLPVCDWQL